MIEFITIGDMRFKKSQIEAYGLQKVPVYDYSQRMNNPKAEIPMQEILVIGLLNRKDKFCFRETDGIELRETLTYLDSMLG